LTHNIETIGQLSCNPSIGGIGKGQLIKEIDALGGAMGICADKAAINIKILNRSKGPATYGTHAVLDRQLYRQEIRRIVENQPNLSIFQQSVEDIIIQGDKVTGVLTQLGIQFNSHTVILTAGTFLNGKIHVGLRNHSGGRAGEQPSINLAERLKELNLPQGRLKTGTPARIDGKTINFTKLQAQYSDGIETGNYPVFSFIGNKNMHPNQIPCYYTRTTSETHEILRSGFDQSPMFTGIIEGVGPRYCPSIEDKITRFANKESHQIILEPEGLNTNEFYPNGISTSLPFEIQYKAIRTIPGLENAHLTRPGYAIEYDYYNPISLKASTESKHIQGLFMAGQIIGSTGYSKAAAMGILSGINAALYVRGEPAWIPGRHEAYIGVMIDDLTLKGITEPYRMFTSRAEFRLHLREDNADTRLTEIGRKLGLIDDYRWNIYCRKQDAVKSIQENLKNIWINPNNVSNEEAENILGTKISHESTLGDILKRPNMTFEQMMKLTAAQKALPQYRKEELDSLFGEELAQSIIEQVVINFKYAGYISKQQDEIIKINQMNNIPLPKDFNYDEITALSTEVKQKMNKFKPETIGQASRIQGVTPAAISIILIYLKKNRLYKNDFVTEKF
jgi:tRNA uridine 5-carboxymethylaminomethyl modification enzyme